MEANCPIQTLTHYAINNDIEGSSKLNEVDCNSEHCWRCAITNVPAKQSKLAYSVENNVVLNMIMNESSSYLKKFNVVDIPVFLTEKCNMQNAIKILFGWSLGIHLQDLAQFLDIEEYVLRYFYKICTHYVKAYISLHMCKWQVGGPGVIVLIDTYPEGCNKFGYEVDSQSSSILCIVEAKDVPPKHWFEVLDNSNLSNQTDKILQVIKTVVRPGSVLVVDASSSVCPVRGLQKLQHLFPLIVGVSDLMKHNNENQNVLTNLQTIWQLSVLVCDNGSYHSDVHSYFTSYLWNQMYGNGGLEVLLKQFSLND